MGTAYLILANGAVFEGEAFGFDAEAVGELVFTTAMTGYLEALTDPGCCGQIILQTFPLAGNYGVIPSDFESGRVHAKAYIVREWCQVPSNFRSEGELDTFLRAQRVPGLCGIDTRALTRILRESGPMNAMLSRTRTLTGAQLAALRQYRVTGAVDAVTARETYTVRADVKKSHAAVWDFGVARSVITALTARGCDVTVVPASGTAAELAALAPDGVLLSGGPGDPEDNPGIIQEIQKLCAYKLPMFGTCLGHQLLALAHGARVTRLAHGHRGANQPVIDRQSGRVFVTSQDHGFAVDASSLPKQAVLSQVSGIDGSCEGLVYTDMPAFSVQYLPDAGLFDAFARMLERGRRDA